MTDETRTAFQGALHRGDFYRAVQEAREMVGRDPGLRQWSYIRRAVESASGVMEPLKVLRVALLSSFSIEFIHDVLVAQAFLNGIRLELYQAGYAQYRQEILDPSSDLFRFRPDLVILAIEGKDFVPDVYSTYLDRIDAGFDSALERAVEELKGLVLAFRKNSEATLLVHNFAGPQVRDMGILDGHVGVGQGLLIHRLNGKIYDLANAQRGMYILDYEGLVSRFGAIHWYDQRMDHYAKAPISHPMLPRLSEEYMKFLRALSGKSKKCMVVDLDNTLWGGVIGEDGIHGIKLGPEYPGSAFRSFQEAILRLYKRGIILAVASKNNLSDVDEVFEKHPHMVLRKEHFTHMEVNWGPKSDSLEAIARRLNIGLEHVVLVDDNPVECKEVLSKHPMATAILLPRQPEQYEEALLREGLFDALAYSIEDRRRSELYRQRAVAEELRTTSGSMEEFYRGLEMEVIFTEVGIDSLARAAQLTQKTNQFNATTARYTEGEVARRMGDPDWFLLTVQVRDRFGDNGIVGVAMGKAEGEVLDIDTFLLSCRVIGRTIETAILERMCGEAKSRGLQSVIGRIIPTAKNAPVRDLYERHGFVRVNEGPAGETTWRMDLAGNIPLCPPWLKIVGTKGKD